MISITKTFAYTVRLAMTVMLGVFAFTLSANAALDMRSAPTNYPTGTSNDAWAQPSNGSTRVGTPTNYPTGTQHDAWTAPSASSRAQTSAAPSASTAQLKAMIESLQKRVAELTKLVQNKNKQAGLSGTGGSSSATSAQITKNLGVGSKGAQVTDLQQCLINLGYFDEDDMDPSFGPKTRQAVKQFQAAEGIANSGNEWTTGYGYVGPKTRNKLNNKCGSEFVEPPLPSSSPSSAQGSGISPQRMQSDCDGQWVTSSGNSPTRKQICVPNVSSGNSPTSRR